MIRPPCVFWGESTWFGTFCVLYVKFIDGRWSNGTRNRILRHKTIRNCKHLIRCIFYGKTVGEVQIHRSKFFTVLHVRFRFNILNSSLSFTRKIFFVFLYTERSRYPYFFRCNVWYSLLQSFEFFYRHRPCWKSQHLSRSWTFRTFMSSLPL